MQKVKEHFPVIENNANKVHSVYPHLLPGLIM